MAETVYTTGIPVSPRNFAAGQTKRLRKMCAGYSRQLVAKPELLASMLEFIY